MSEYIELFAWICVIGIVFAIVTIPFKATEKPKNKKDRDATIQFVVGKPMLIDKRRWDNVNI